MHGVGHDLLGVGRDRDLELHLLRFGLLVRMRFLR